MIIMPDRWNLEVKQKKFAVENEVVAEPVFVAEEPETTGKTKAIIYDMDNTLVDTDGFVLDHLRRTAMKVCQEISFMIPTDEEIKQVQKMNLPFEAIFISLFPSPVGYTRDEPLSSVVLAKYREDAKEMPYSPTFSGTEIVNEMSFLGIVQGIVTNRVKMARHRLDQAGYGEFEFIVQPESREQSKPNPLSLKPALDYLKEKGISKNEVVSVGDHPDDYLAAKGTGIRFIAVLTGESQKEDFVELGLDASMIVNNLGELKEKIN